MVTSQLLQKTSPRLICKRSKTNKETVNIPLRGLLSPMKKGNFCFCRAQGTLRVPISRQCKNMTQFVKYILCIKICYRELGTRSVPCARQKLKGQETAQQRQKENTLHLWCSTYGITKVVVTYCHRYSLGYDLETCQLVIQ